MNKIKYLTERCQQSTGIIQQVMARNQYVSVVIFDEVKEATKEKPHTYKQREMRRPRLSLSLFWEHLNLGLSIDAWTEFQAARLVWKLSRHNFKMSHNLLYKWSTVCLMLAQKLCEDQTNTLESFSLLSGVSMKQLKQLELEALSLFEFNLNLSEEQRQALPQCLTQFQTYSGRQ